MQEVAYPERFMRIIGLAAVLAALLAASAHAQVYQWRDAQGQIHYGDQPPLGVNAKLLRGATPPRPVQSEAPAPLESTPMPAQSTEPLEAPRPSPAEARQQAAAERQREEALQQNCLAARNQLAALESGQRIARFTESGEREFLNDEQRAQEMMRSRKLVQEICQN